MEELERYDKKYRRMLCIYCDAPPGEPCRNVSDDQSKYERLHHSSRIEDYRRAVAAGDIR